MLLSSKRLTYTRFYVAQSAAFMFTTTSALFPLVGKLHPAPSVTMWEGYMDTVS